ncbi:MAG TPA: hypothetical protein VFB07_04805 [Vicinamibacterales bacterium]|nr:hypothetical protein [Vicinamibacterales bacterium]
MKLVVLAAMAAMALQAGGQTPMPRGQMPDLGRPTKPGDELPPFNADDYFPGQWRFEWDVPEGALGDAGRIEGLTTYKALGGGRFDATTAATGAWGNFTVHEVLTYDKQQKTVARSVEDSRGFSYQQTGTIGGDLGGFWNVYLEGTPFTFHGHAIRIKHNLRLLSPLNYKVGVTVSVDGGPFRNYGNPWWRKDPTA